MSDFTKEAKKAMIDLDLTYDQVADVMGISKSYLSDLINGNRKSKERLDELKKILQLEEVEPKDE